MHPNIDLLNVKKLQKLHHFGIMAGYSTKFSAERPIRDRKRRFRKLSTKAPDMDYCRNMAKYHNFCNESTSDYLDKGWQNEKQTTFQGPEKVMFKTPLTGTCMANLYHLEQNKIYCTCFTKWLQLEPPI